MSDVKTRIDASTASKTSEFRPEKGVKLAQRLATHIEKDIIADGWKVGKSLGQEADLITRYQVSRAILREAIAILEQDGIAQMARGPNGGLVVIAPAEQTAALVIRNYLEASRIESKELLEARRLVEGVMLRLAAQRLTAGSLKKLRDLDAQVRQLDKPPLALARQLLTAIAHVSGNPALATLVAALAQLGVSLTYYKVIDEREIQHYLEGILKIRHEQVEALIGNDTLRLIQTLDSQQVLLSELHSKISSGNKRRKPVSREHSAVVASRLMAMGETKRKVKLADVVSLQLQMMIIQMGWPEGEKLSSEAQLLEQLGVSRAVLREAIRGLERLGVVRAESGRHGGLFVAVPDPRQTIRSVLLYLHHMKITKVDIHELQEEFEPAAVTALTMAVRESGSALLEPLRRVVARADEPQSEIGLREYMSEFYETFIDSCPNRILGFFLRIFFFATRHLYAPRKKAEAARLREYIGLHKNLLSAIEAGEEGLARRQMIELRRQVYLDSPPDNDRADLIENSII